jgi:LPS sulfotransferase NodH
LAATGKLIVVLAMPRSGSHFLRSLLARSGAVDNYNEVFNTNLTETLPHNFGKFLREKIRRTDKWHFDAASAETVLNDYFDLLEKRARRRPILIDIKDNQLRIADWPPCSPARAPRLLSVILERQYPIIRLVRHDLLAQCASNELARQTEQWVVSPRSKRRQTAVPTIELDVRKTLRHIRETRTSSEMIARWLSTRPHVARLTYEGFIQKDRLSRAARLAIAKATGIAIADDATGETEKIAPALQDYVSNLDAILEKLEGTNLAFLRDIPRAKGRVAPTVKASRANGAAKVPFILTNFRRPQNLPRLVEICLKSKYSGDIIVIDNAPDDALRESLDFSSGRVDYRPNFANLGAGHRFTVASQLDTPQVVAIDDDLFPTVEQIDTLIERARADPGRLHGIWGERLTQRDGHPHFANAVYGQNRDIDIVNRVYVFDPTQAMRADRLRKRVGFTDWLKAIPSDDVLLSFASDRKPRMHDLGPIEDCPTSGAEGIAQWRHENFIQRRWQVVAKLSRLRPARKVPFL